MIELLKKVEDACKSEYKKGVVATYIPELGNANPSDFGIAIATNNGEIFYTGDAEKQFTMQSIIKPIILLLAIQDAGHEKVRKLVGVESTGKPFDSFNYSDLALTGVGVCMPLILLISAFAALISSSGAPRASIFMGKGDYDSAERTMGSCFTLQCILVVVASFPFLFYFAVFIGEIINHRICFFAFDN